MVKALPKYPDPDFAELFKVAADFNDETDRTPENCQLYAQMLANLAASDQTRPLERAAVALRPKRALARPRLR